MARISSQITKSRTLATPGGRSTTSELYGLPAAPPGQQLARRIVGLTRLRRRLLASPVGSNPFDPFLQAGHGRLGGDGRDRLGPEGGPPGWEVLSPEDQAPHRDIDREQQDGQDQEELADPRARLNWGDRKPECLGKVGQHPSPTG